MVNRLIALNTKHFSDKQKNNRGYAETQTGEQLGSLMSCSARSGFAAMSQIFVPVRRRKRTGCHSSALTTRLSRTTIVHRIASCPKPSPL